MSQKSFLDNKKITKEFSICWGGEGGVNQHMENSICFVVFIFESFPYAILIAFCLLWLAPDAVEGWLPSELGLHALCEWHLQSRSYGI